MTLIGIKNEIIFILSSLGEIAFTPRAFWRKVIFGDVPYNTIRSTINRAQKSGLIGKKIRNNQIHLYLTDKAQKKIVALHKLKHFQKPKWDGWWRLISFDVPEPDRKGRDFLREKLKELGFGQSV